MIGFECAISIPIDSKFSETLTALAVQAARQAGCDEAAAGEFAAAVADAWHGCLRAQSRPTTHAADIVFRRLASEVEAVLTCGDRVRIAHPAPIDV